MRKTGSQSEAAACREPGCSDPFTASCRHRKDWGALVPLHPSLAKAGGIKPEGFLGDPLSRHSPLAPSPYLTKEKDEAQRSQVT